MSDVFSLGYLIDQINRLAHLPLLASISAQCMEDIPRQRPHLADVVESLSYFEDADDTPSENELETSAEAGDQDNRKPEPVAAS